MANDQLPRLKRADCTLTYEASGTNLLFEDIVNSYYMAPVGESISLCQHSKRVFVPNSTIASAKARGLGRTTKETKRCIATLLKVIEESVAQIPALRAASHISRGEVLAAMARFKIFGNEYLYFDAFYWDGVYEKSETDPVAAEQVELVQSFKNVARSKVEQIFFDKDGYLLILCQKLGAQFNIPERDLEWYRESEILSLFEGKRVPQDELVDRRRAYLLSTGHAGDTHLYSGQVAEEFIAAFDTGDEAEKDVFIGISANKTSKKIRAKVRIIRRDYGDKEATKKQMNDMMVGEVLVSETTDPELIPAFKKASAVVTDISGLLSHAAITSREMNLPCIVGTGNASKILKTGDLVEVNAEKGTVRILEKHGV